MKRKRLFKKMNNTASVGTYVFLLFGITVMLYMFGYTNGLYTYIGQAEIGTSGFNVTNSSVLQDKDYNPIMLFINGLIQFCEKNTLMLGVGIAGLVVITLVGSFINIGLNVVYSYVIPLVIIGVVLNLFIFPIGSLTENLGQFIIWSVPVSWFIIMFLNLMYVLAVLEFVRTGTTT